MEEVSIPGSVKTIGLKAFYKLESLQKVTFHEGLETIEEKAFGKCYLLKEIEIPSTVMSIGRVAFQGEYLVSITIPPHLYDIEAIDYWGVDERTCKIIVNEN